MPRVTPWATRRRLSYLAIGVVAVVGLAFLVPYVYANFIADDAPAPLALETAEPDPSEDPATPPADFTPDGTWAVSDGSEAGYRVDEVLNGQDVTVVGRTPDVAGEVVIADGALTEGSVEVDMTTVTTDSGSRDSQFQGMIMNTAEFPTSSFVLTEPLPLDGLGAASGPVTVTAEGELTIRDVTRTVQAELSVQLGADDTAQVAGAIPVTFADFGVDAPDLGFVRVEEAGLVEFLLHLER